MTHHRRTAHLLLAVLCAVALGGCTGTVAGDASPAEPPAAGPVAPEQPGGGTGGGDTAAGESACGLLQPDEVSAVLDAYTSSSFPVPDASMCSWISDDQSGRMILLLVSGPGVPVDPTALDAFGSLGAFGTGGATSSGSLGFEGNGRGGYLVVVTTDPAGGAAVAQRLVDLVEPRL